MFSALNGEYWEDRWNTFKMFLWLALGAGCVFCGPDGTAEIVRAGRVKELPGMVVFSFLPPGS